MAIIHYPGYLTKEEAARRQKVQVRTINIRIQKKSIAFIKIDNWFFVKDLLAPAVEAPHILLSELEWLPNCAKRNRVSTDRIYDQIILGNITGVVVVDKVFVQRNDPGLLALPAGKRRL